MVELSHEQYDALGVEAQAAYIRGRLDMAAEVAATMERRARPVARLREVLRVEATWARIRQQKLVERMAAEGVLVPGGGV